MTSSPPFTIGGRPIGREHDPFVIAEIGLNHDGLPERALALVDAAAEAGAHAVKLQSLRAATLVANAPASLAHVDAASLREVFSRYELDEAAHAAVAARAWQRGLAFLSTPFDEAAVDMLVRLGCDAVKIASGDLTHHRLIARAARTGRPLILSTGLSLMEEVIAAVRCARDAGASSIALLHCVSAYPVPDDQQNLAAIATLASATGLPVGLSDHSRHGADAGLAVALGLAIYERHIKADDDDQVIDAAVSSSPAQLRTIVEAMRRARLALGTGRREPQPAELPNLQGSRRGLYAARALPPGHLIEDEDLVALRPATGIDASRRHELIGLRTRRALAEGEAFVLDDLAGRQAREAREQHGAA